MAQQQTVLVTGGASGIGLAVVEAILAEGWRAIVADLDHKNLDRCREVLSPSNNRVRFERMNVADEDDVVRTIATCEAEFGPITGIVNSAGIGRDVPALDTDVDLFRKMLEVNLIGSFVVARDAAKLMRERGGGSIVNIASVSGVMGNKGRVAYGASKGAVITMTKVMAVELASFGIRVNAIAPGPIETPLVQEVHTPDVRAAWMITVPQRRYGSPDEIAGTAVFLLDSRKSSYITGQTICVDGGFSIAGILNPAPNPSASLHSGQG
ncbi:SDR family NAD(P)-dependent oxidoreductase [Microvirga sp. CF3016]|uniref:SDR family NAD(P)-dependent oxidoreductase n=1 Tax=Microvirga sp. CF3016 TaxID=3110181 RepID=UPI002E7A5561|nr:SDR family NAD(P)-dependent oxidoreductase [Microvirga sp. CF3016]MEE1612183.1 SDR family NAD(P)-dependent oxidoreductase [Microvirga sp. CF3016]